MFIEALESRCLYSATYGPARSVAIKGDWNGDGQVLSGAVKKSTLYLDLNGDHKVEKATEQFNLGVNGGTPVVMDVNSNGRDEVGLFINGYFVIDTNDDHTITPDDLAVQETSPKTKIKAVKAYDVNRDGHKDLCIQFASDKQWRVDFWRTTEDLPAFASALKDAGVKFYGAFWCPHCRRQKEMFGDGFKMLPYIECSNADHTKNQAGIDNAITTYPTWVFSNGARLTGEQSLQKISDAALITIPIRANFAGSTKTTLVRLV